MRRMLELGAADKDLEAFCVLSCNPAQDEAHLICRSVLGTFDSFNIEPASRLKAKLPHIGQAYP